MIGCFSRPTTKQSSVSSYSAQCILYYSAYPLPSKWTSSHPLPRNSSYTCLSPLPLSLCLTEPSRNHRPSLAPYFPRPHFRSLISSHGLRLKHSYAASILQSFNSSSRYHLDPGCFSPYSLFCTSSTSFSWTSYRNHCTSYRKLTYSPRPMSIRLALLILIWKLSSNLWPFLYCLRYQPIHLLQ